MRCQHLSLLFLAGSASARALALKHRNDAVPQYFHVPIDFDYGVDSRMTANLTFGTEANANPVKVVMDTGSANFWIWQPNATVHWGSPYLGVIGPCSLTVPTGYDPNVSSTAHLTNHSSSYAYAGNAKIVQGRLYANDTMAAVGGNGAFPNVQVALESEAIIRQLDDGTCVEIEYDKGILGLAPHIDDTRLAPGPLFRDELYDAGVLASRVLFVWMDRFAGALGEVLTGGMLFSAVDTSKYVGDLVRVRSSQAVNTVGVYVVKPNVTFNGHTVVPDQDTACLVDSGAHYDVLPFSYDGAALQTFFNVSGGQLVEYNGIFAYKGTCDSIPASLNMSYTFAGAAEGESISIDIPLRNFARGYNISGTEGMCVLNLEYGGCTLGATFLTGATMALDDADGSVAFAQGGVSKRRSGVDEKALKILARGQSYDSF